MIQSERPTPGGPCTLDQLADWICESAEVCPHAAGCAAQKVGPDAVCFAVHGDRQFDLPFAAKALVRANP